MVELNAVELVRDQANPPVIVLLKALYLGIPIKLAGTPVVLVKTVADGEQFVTYNPGLGKHSYVLGLEMPFAQLTELANKLTQDDLFLLAADITMNKERLKNARK